MEEEPGDANRELGIVLGSLLNDESATMVRDGWGGEQQTPFAVDAKPLLTYAGQLD